MKTVKGLRVVGGEGRILVLPWHLFDPMPELASTLPRSSTVAEVVTRPGSTGRPWLDLAELYRPLRDEVSRSDVPVIVLSGDCVASLAVLTGTQHQGERPCLVWFDAHGDFHTEATSTSGYLGGLPLAKAVGRGDLSLPDALGLTPLSEDAVTLVDARDLDPPEVTALDHSKVEHVSLEALDPDLLPTGPLVVHVDLDIIDPSELQGLRFPAVGGPSLPLVANAVRDIVCARPVVALDVAATWDPARADPHQTRTVLESLLSVLVG